MRMIRTAGSAELEVRRSRFICTLTRLDSESEAAGFLDRHRRAHRDAAHNCTAFVLGDNGEISRSSDDGEPAGTAGVPMLQVLIRHSLTNTLAVVTRYFGGTKLGAGGLVRAYGEAVSTAIQRVGLVERKPVVTMTITVDHGSAGRLVADLHGLGYLPDVRYGAAVEIDVSVLEPDAAAFTAQIAEATAGQALVDRGPRRYAEFPAE